MAWDVPNKKGRVASILSLIFWSILISFIIIKGDFSAYPVLMLIVFILLDILTVVRIYQEWKENGEWLEPKTEME
ncbi:MAG: hypothetical protein KAS67_01675 [Thermoplasmata archaeon]|nr:hypothetical protein [Thermoplasmata archaeon]